MDYMGNFYKSDEKVNNEELNKAITLRVIIGIIITLVISFSLIYYGISSKYKELNKNSTDKTDNLSVVEIETKETNYLQI